MWTYRGYSQAAREGMVLSTFVECWKGVCRRLGGWRGLRGSCGRGGLSRFVELGGRYLLED